MIVLQFPPPPLNVMFALELLHNAGRTGGGRSLRGDAIADLERPWEPAGCTGELAAAVWDWCGDVVAWINREYAWRPSHMIPVCWLRHPHIARELPVLAVMRWNAECAVGPEAVEEWNRYALPMFCDRMTDRLGESSCRTGRHQDWPAEGRYSAFLDGVLGAPKRGRQAGTS